VWLPETVRTLALRVELQSAVIQEIARCLSPKDAARCADAVRVKAQLLLARCSPLPEAVDVAVTAELSGLLTALGQPPEI